MKDEYLEDSFDNWYENEAKERLEALGFSEVDIPIVRSLCKEAWLNGAYVEKNKEIKWH